MQIGWDSKTDTFFINSLTDAEAGALQGTLVGVYCEIKRGKIILIQDGLKDGGEFLNDLQDGLLKAKQIKTKIQER